ncbi:hypothetical protein MYCTH_2307326 [Thermothelomyces thermophilus ATCC 42464]|uniref:C2H2-type domain-containing protein n=1 Tax=Thermothelomyces thermophilus (strain ATCC 42464 / BCRC 31852 / DSM 1799) TaxID=573729 RepID=G2QFK8_THET4|nr:uncharacterized protein MYCTH_2307326 [Thermothelomyces thermophilus ATCC 42464]AEO59225.1 hypothetical protein MYCTH_2307326 [Thermothelomyces thermophilus ATCC 42464]
MASYPNPWYPSAMNGFQTQDGGWYGAAGMKRSDSQSTSCTVDTSCTASTVASGYSSATDISSAEYACSEDTIYGDMPSLCPDLCSFREPPDANHIPSATGSQYLDNGGSWPQPLPLSSPLPALGTRAGNEDAAWQATLAANSLITNRQPPGNGRSSLISSVAVDEAVKMHQDRGVEEPVRPAIQDVLYRHLRPRFSDIDHYYADIIQLLEEAAYQLQVRLQGPQVMEICSIAIAAVLAMLSEDAGADNNGANPGWPDSHGSPSATARASPEKERFKCHYPGCNNGASRQADLERHYKIMHLADDEKVRYFCDYKKCPRHKAPFFRQDHFRDHLREYHKEDLLRRGNKGDDEWWSSRSPHALYNGWWRCSRCLIRVRLDKDGFTCPDCSGSCEKERQQHRTMAAGAELRADSSNGSSPSLLRRHPAPAPLGRRRIRSSS